MNEDGTTNGPANYGQTSSIEALALAVELLAWWQNCGMPGWGTHTARTASVTPDGLHRRWYMSLEPEEGVSRLDKWLYPTF